jgi:uncharacterized protein (DUF1015 family)
MSTLVRPFAALRPRAEHAAAVIAPPYDVVSFEEAVRLAHGRPASFLHISRPEIDLGAGTDPHAEAVYAKGAQNLERLKALGVLVRDPEPGYYVYRMRMGEHEQTGIGLTASVRAYEENRVRKHELTRPDKEDDRVRNILALNAQTGPVLCAYRANREIESLISHFATGRPLFEVAGPHDVTHTVWRIAEPEAVASLSAALNALDALYIADGHHRSAAAARVAAERRSAGAGTEAGSEYFLAVAFPHDEMNILDYNRVVKSLGGLSSRELLAELGRSFDVDASPVPAKPARRGTFGMYLDGQWYRLTLPEETIPRDPVGQLDVSLLQERIVGPLLRIRDQRTDPRIDFVGGVRGLQALEREVDSGRAAAAFALYPTAMEQLMAVADAGKLMPPKSTWFEPKLADGLLSHVLD